MNPETPYQPNKIFLAIIVLLVALEAILFLAGDFHFTRVEKNYETTVEKIRNNTIPIVAKAFSIYDITDNKKLYGKNDTLPLPLASLAKSMTVVTALNGHQMDDVVSISAEAIKQSGDYGLLANEKWKIGDLAKFTLIISANDGAHALALSSGDAASFLDAMNAKAKRIGMMHAKFFNFTGLDLYNDKGLPIKAGAMASAEEANLMSMYVLQAYPDIFKVTTLPEISLISDSGFHHDIKNTDILIDKIPNLLFSKTGFTDLAGGNLSIIFQNKRGHQIAITVLGSTFDGRFTDMENLVNLLYNI